MAISVGCGIASALAFVRFRTPVKDPAEIGFVLLLAACSIGAATNTFLVTGLLLAGVFVALVIQWLTRNRFTLFGRSHLMISVDQPSFPDLEAKLSRFLEERLRGLRLETMSVLEDRVSLHYQYRRQARFDWTAFTSDLNQLAGPAKVEIFIG